MAIIPPTQPQPDTGPIEQPEPTAPPTELPPMPDNGGQPTPMQA